MHTFAHALVYVFTVASDAPVCTRPCARVYTSAVGAAFQAAHLPANGCDSDLEGDAMTEELQGSVAGRGPRLSFLCPHVCCVAGDSVTAAESWSTELRGAGTAPAFSQRGPKAAKFCAWSSQPPRGCRSPTAWQALAQPWWLCPAVALCGLVPSGGRNATFFSARAPPLSGRLSAEKGVSFPFAQRFWAKTVMPRSPPS